MKQLRNALTHLLNGLAGVSFLAMVVLTCWQVVTRYLLQNPSSWSEELVSYLFAWMALLGASLVTSERGHMNIPVIVERIAFAVGKVIVNSMSTVYGSWTVGALGISNNIGGITTNPQNGFQEGGSSIISQNLGAGRPKRALLAFRWVLYIDMLIGLVIMTASLLCLNQLAGLFAGDNAEFAEMIKQIYRFEAVGAIPLGVNAAVMALLYGFGKTRVTLVMNFCRVFLFRVPVLWALQQFTDLGNVSAGIVMAVSNVASGVLAAVVGVIEIRRICNTYDVRYFGGERKN